MSQRLNSVALFLTLLGGLVGGIVTSQLALRGLVPSLLPPRTLQVRTAFQLIDNNDWLRIQLGKNGLSFFERKTGEVIVKLDGERRRLLLRHGQGGVHRSVNLTPIRPYAVQGAQSVARHTWVRLPEQQSPPGPPKPGIFIKDGQMVWEVADAPRK